MGSNPFVATIYGLVAELADALASRANIRKDVWVRVPPRPPFVVRVVQWIGLQITNLAIRVRLPA